MRVLGIKTSLTIYTRELVYKLLRSLVFQFVPHPLSLKGNYVWGIRFAYHFAPLRIHSFRKLNHYIQSINLFLPQRGLYSILVLFRESNQHFPPWGRRETSLFLCWSASWWQTINLFKLTMPTLVPFPLCVTTIEDRVFSIEHGEILYFQARIN